MAKDRIPQPIRLSSAFKVGAVALVFLIIGFQLALFVRQAAVDAVVAHRDAPDTVYIVAPAVAPDESVGADASARKEDRSGVSKGDYWHKKGAGTSRQSGRVAVSGTDAASAGASTAPDTVRRNAVHSRRAVEMAAAEGLVNAPGKRTERQRRAVESFAFDPNTVSVEDLQRLGFSPKQAQSIESYRNKGGRFRRKSDFARSYVVADSVYERLEPFIDIPLLDINLADSAAFETLPGIGPYFASKMVEYRERLHGYSYPEQLMDIWRFDREKYDALCDLITVGECAPYPLWSLPEDSLALHPYIGRYAAHGVVLYIQNTPPEERSVMDLKDILKPGMAEKLSGCRLE